MPSLVARFAENIYWLGRYLERAESIARILDINETYARDLPTGPDWHRILDLYTERAAFTKRYAKHDPASILNFFVLDRDNPNSVASTIAAARHNARTVRHLISTEMWMHINILHGEISAKTQDDISAANLSRLCNEIRTGCQTFEGIAEGTFLRGEAWCFYQLGKYVERADQTTRILDMVYDRLAMSDGNTVETVHWHVLLRSVSGYHAYRSRYPNTFDPKDIVSFLLYDVEFPRAVSLCSERLTVRLRNLDKRYNLGGDSNLEHQRRDLEFALETGPGDRLTPTRLHRFIDQIQAKLGQLSAAIGNNYFNT